MTLLTATVVLGCAGQAARPPTLTAQSTAPAIVAGDPSTEAELQRLTLAKKLRLKVVNQDGEELFCQSSMVTGSHIRTDMRCFTAEQLDRYREQEERDMDRFNQQRTPTGTIPLSR